MAGTSRDISIVMTSAANNYNTRLDLSVFRAHCTPRHVIYCCEPNIYKPFAVASYAGDSNLENIDFFSRIHQEI